MIGMKDSSARFSVGQLVRHRLFDYRAVVVDVDATCQASDEWYDQVALTRPPKDQPWYRVLVHNAVHETYVAERNLDADDSQEPVNHPGVTIAFDDFQDGRYVVHHKMN